jgi:hypothetical protein
MPIIGAIELRDLLTPLIDALTVQGVIIPETPSPTVMMSTGRPHQGLPIDLHSASASAPRQWTRFHASGLARCRCRIGKFSG